MTAHVLQLIVDGLQSRLQASNIIKVEITGERPFFKQGFQSGNALAFFHHSVAVAVISNGFHNHFNRDEKFTKEQTPGAI